MKNNLRKGNCCLTCNHRVTKKVEVQEFVERVVETHVFCNLDKSLDVTIESDSQDGLQWQANHYVEADDLCDNFQKVS